MSVAAPAPRVLLVVGRFYPAIADALVAGADTVLENAGARREVAEVPGAFEIPAAIAIADDSAAFDGYVALGCVIRGETTHYDHVCEESARALGRLAVERRLAVGYGILTVDTAAQARARVAADRGNKGAAAASACLAMIAIRDRFRAAPRTA